MLTYLLSDKFSVEKRKQVLAQDYNIRMKEVYEGVDDMSGLGAAIREEARKEGRREGRREGIQDMILNLYKLGMNTSMIAKAAELAEQEVLDIIEKYTK